MEELEEEEEEIREEEESKLGAAMVRDLPDPSCSS